MAKGAVVSAPFCAALVSPWLTPDALAGLTTASEWPRSASAWVMAWSTGVTSLVARKPMALTETKSKRAASTKPRRETVEMACRSTDGAIEDAVFGAGGACFSVSSRKTRPPSDVCWKTEGSGVGGNVGC